MTNTGDRPGREIVQVYLAPREPGGEHPARVLAGFAAVQAGPGETVEVPVALARRAAEYWDADEHAWRPVPGGHDVQAGRSYADVRLSAPLPGA
ncbi:fibronectin type III-like domain-contianing protein [Nocardiopsis potens]|uniref:fibronectin type III-like domain-contianing protein n=1 Tax=Nocardiopsis potens TaxID=1246458 RepID=UPI00373AF078